MLKKYLHRHSGLMKQALELIGGNVMVADADLNILYMNEAVRSLLQTAEADLQRELPRFSMATLIGSNIDIFHKNPSHQRNMLASLQKPHSATIRVGAWIFDLRVTPLRRGNRIAGFAVEWADARERLMNLDYQAQLLAIGRAQAVVEFTVDGEIVTANANFLASVDYKLDEIRGKHHSMFVDAAYADSDEYRLFWEKLRAGNYQASEFRYLGRNGKIAIVNASYNPVLDAAGRVTKVVQFATDVTERVVAVGEIADALQRLSEGNLGFRLDRPFAADFESLRENFNGAVIQLNSALLNVSCSATEIDTGTREVSENARELGRRTEQQAAALEETAAALDEITANVSNSSKRTQEARLAAEEANNKAVQSGQIVQQAMGAMSRIEASSSQIASIISVIDEIAFQTNLLALNAGVEAARAGEAGKGFAVVAQEVRELAQRSARAAKEIAGLIGNSSREVQSGVRLVGDTGVALRSIEEAIALVNDHMQAIASAAHEQAQGITEVNGAVNQMDQVTQKNTAMVEKLTASSAVLAGETEQLRQLVGNFVLDDTPARGSRPPHLVAVA